MKKEEIEAVKAQIALYKQWRGVLQFGDFYRGRSGDVTEWTCVSENQKKAVGFLMQKLVVPNKPYEDYHAKGLDEEKLYHFYNRKLQFNVKEFGGLINAVAPIHVKQDSLTQNIIARFVKMDGEVEDYEAYGDTLMYNGVKLHQAFPAGGYNDQVRHFTDFASRMYFMENLK
jgi:alpha-galactosidase